MARFKEILSKWRLWREYILIFVCLGSQIFQMNRLLKKLDVMISEGCLEDKVIAQIGHSEYLPRNYKYKRFMDKDEFKNYQEQADLIITHGGTGAIIGASKLGKNIIAVPRLAKYREHVDDHQLQIVRVLEEEGYIRVAYDVESLYSLISLAIKKPITKKYNRESKIYNIITDFIDNDTKER